uniref:Uncharacterized protein n=1 Tax=Oryza nivara TaxID=4536 RepID=A0A0E0G1D5_ORYNI
MLWTPTNTADWTDKPTMKLSWAGIHGPRVVVSLRAQHEPESFDSSPRLAAGRRPAATGGRLPAAPRPCSSSSGPVSPDSMTPRDGDAATPFNCSTQCQGEGSGTSGGSGTEPLRCEAPRSGCSAKCPRGCPVPVGRRLRPSKISWRWARRPGD